MQRPSFKTLFCEKELWFLVGIGIFYFYRVLFLGETFFFRDLAADVIPQKSLFAYFIQARELPLWTPYPHGGQPYWADITYFPLYPINLLYAFLPFFRAFNLNAVLHILLGAICAYLFARVVGLNPLSSYIVGMVYGFCGYTLSLLNLAGRFLVIPHIPLLFLSWHLYLLDGKKKWFVIAVFSGVCQVFSGAPETNIISLLSLLGWSIAYPYNTQTLRRKLALWIALGIFILGVAAIQLVPTMEMAAQSYRQSGLPYSAFTLWSLYPKQFPEFIFPGFFGRANLIPQNVYYWGSTLMIEKAPLILSIYFGAVALCLAMIGGLHKQSSPLLPGRARRFLCCLFLASLLLSLGRFVPGFPVLYKVIPLMHVFRYAIKFLVAGLFPLAVLAGYGAELYFGNSPTKHEEAQNVPSTTMVSVFWGIAILLSLFTISFQVSAPIRLWVLQGYFKQPESDIIRRGLSEALNHATVIWLGLTVLVHYRKFKQNSWQPWMLAALLTVDLLSASQHVNLYAPEELFTKVPETVQLVRREIGDGRFFRPDDSPAMMFRAPSDDVLWSTRWDLEFLKYTMPTFYRIPLIFHKELALTPVRIFKLKLFVDLLPWEKRLPLLSAAAVTVILTQETLSLPEVERITDLPNRSNLMFYLYRNKAAVERVHFVTSGKLVTSDKDALDAMLAPEYDPRKQVVLQKPEKTMFDLDFLSPADNVLDSKGSECPAPAQIHKQRATTHSAEFTVSTRCDGYLVFSEPFYPGWRAYVDGKRTPLWRANYAFTAIPLPAGEHEVKRAYRPLSVVLGALCSVIFGIGLWVIKI